MSGITDPAHELVQLLETLAAPSEMRASSFLADKFHVEEGSLEFYKILFSVIERIDLVSKLIETSPDTSHIRDDMIDHLGKVKIVFNVKSLNSSWSGIGAPALSSSNLLPLKMASPLLRQQVSYPSLLAEERDEVLALVEQLLEWLESHQLEDNDFIRQAIIDGLKMFVFRLERLEILGWGYSVDSLKEIITAYMAMEGGFHEDDTMPITQAALIKVGSTMKQVFERVGIAKDITERADFMLKTYGAVAIVMDGSSGISGLLT